MYLITVIKNNTRKYELQGNPQSNGSLLNNRDKNLIMVGGKKKLQEREKGFD